MRLVYFVLILTLIVTFGLTSIYLFDHFQDQDIISINPVSPSSTNSPKAFQNLGQPPVRKDCSHDKCLEGYKQAVRIQTENPSPASVETLKKVLKVDQILENRSDKPGEVWTESEESPSGYIKTKYLFYNELTGYMTGSLVRPDTPTKLPLVIALHGHYEDSEYFAKERFGFDLVDQGVAVFYIDFKAMDLDDDEALTMKKLIHAGYTFMGMRIYDVELLIDYFSSQQDINSENIFVLGHSGGAEVAQYTALIDSRVKHVISDNPLYTFLRMGESNSFHDEFIPDYQKIMPQNLEHLVSNIDLLEVEYGYNEEDKLTVYQWIRERIK